MLACVVAFASSAAEAGDSPTSPPAHTHVSQAVKVTLLRVGGLPAVGASVDGSKPYPFIVDWAANLLAINPDKAGILGLSASGTDEMGNPKIAIADLSISHARFEGLTAAADPFLSGHPEAGVLGVNVFRDATITLDLAHNTLTIDTKGLPPANGRDIFRYERSEGGAPMVALTVCGIRISANVDTAAPAALRLPRSMIDKLRCRHHPLSNDQVVGAQSGPTGTTDVQIDGDMSVGSVTIKKPVVRLGDGPATFIGAATLSRLAVTLDQRHQLIRIVKSSTP